MRSAIVALFLIAFCFSCLDAATRQRSQSTVSSSPSAAGQSEIQDLRQDIQRMKSLVQQMEMNLAFVDTTQSPLKHQFQLEIDMWKTVIASMERKLESSKRP